MSDLVVEWAYRVLGDSPVARVARIEVGSSVLEALKASTASTPDDDSSRYPRSTVATLLGVPLTGSAELDPLGWCTYDGMGAVLASGELTL